MRRRILSAAVLAAALLALSCDDLFPDDGFEPTGTPFTLAPGIDLVAATGDPRLHDLGPVTLAITLTSSTGQTETDDLPAGLFFRPGGRVQNVILLKGQPVVAGTTATKTLLGSFCCNFQHLTPNDDDTLELGPVTDNPDLRQIIDLVEDRDISGPSDMAMVQNAVYMVTDSGGLNQAYIDSLGDLPPDTTAGAR